MASLRDLLSLGGFILGAVICDWLAVTRGGAYFIEFDYRYWPLTRYRKLGLVAVILAGIDMWASAPPNAATWKEVCFAFLMVAWAITIFADVFAQRRAGYQTPPRYSDTIDC